jgi:hypothetical protein
MLDVGHGEVEPGEREELDALRRGELDPGAEPSAR